MKASVSLLFLFLIAAGCTDATTDPTGLTPPTSVAGSKAGNPPPPPVDAAVFVCVDGGGCAVFDGTYMTNTGDEEGFGTAVVARAPGEEGACTYPGHSSLKIDKQLEPELFDAKTSANAQIKCSHRRASGGGTIEIGGVEVRLERVVAFDNSPECTARCGEFVVHDEEDNEVATGVVFEREYYDRVCDEQTEGGPFCGIGGD